MANAGIVVIVIYFTCLYRLTPATDAERLVVSERGETLSPKYAPEMIAPASQPTGSPIIVPALSMATPMVPTVVHELPARSDTIAQSRNVTSRNTLGWITISP